jgi:hypothetical protein
VGHLLTAHRSLLTALALVAAGALGGCRGTLSPLSNRLKIGAESYIVFSADGEDGLGDLFASPPSGSPTFQITFTRVDEREPTLSPDGVTLAFLRSRNPTDTTQVTLALLNLQNGAERRIALDPGYAAESPLRLAWAPGGNAAYLRTRVRTLRTPAPPASLELTLVPPNQLAASDSAFSVPLGDPPVGEAFDCAAGKGVCARLASGETVMLSPEGSDPFRWGTDSVGFREDGAYVVQPLGGGRVRTIRLAETVRHAREFTYFAGQGRGTGIKEPRPDP